MGQCHKTESEAGRTTVREFLLLREAAEQAERRRWERARWQMFLMLQQNPYVKQKPSTPALWVPFGWEKEAEIKRAQSGEWAVSDKEKKELDAMLQEFINGK